jgi:hypothetical protein
MQRFVDDDRLMVAHIAKRAVFPQQDRAHIVFATNSRVIAALFRKGTQTIAVNRVEIRGRLLGSNSGGMQGGLLKAERTTLRSAKVLSRDSVRADHELVVTDLVWHQVAV